MRRWYGYLLAQVMALALFGISFAASDAYDEPAYSSFFDMGLVLALFPTVPAALALGIVEGIVAGGTPRTLDRAQMACAVSFLSGAIVAFTAMWLQDLGDLTAGGPLPNPPSQWAGALAGMEIGLALGAATGALVSAGMRPSLKEAREREE